MKLLVHVRATSCDNIDAFGGVAELADAGDLKSLDFGCEGSSPSAPTILKPQQILNGLS